jgi:urease accessory protein
MKKMLAATLALILISGSAQAHVGHNAGFSALEGFFHPLLGVDHLTAMLAVGLWSSQGGGRRLVLWPLAFVVAMLIGGISARYGLSVPYIEPMIAGSLAIVGVLIVLAVNAPTAVGAAIVALFALAHGHAHGTEAPALGWIEYAAGFASATALIHAAGIGLGKACNSLLGAAPVRTLGLVPVAIGVAALIR